MPARHFALFSALCVTLLSSGCGAPAQPATDSAGHALRGARSLDELSKLDIPALDALYAAANDPWVPEIKAGNMRGRLLAVSAGAASEIAREVIGVISGTGYDVWLGKTFKPISDELGEGHNRLKIGSVWRTAHFDYFVGPSRAGEFNAIQLSYSRWDNVPVLWPLKDEMRQVAPGLWLGQAYLEMGQSVFLFYFGLEGQP
jgi:hypothetical protein